MIGKGFGIIHHRIPSFFIQDNWHIINSLRINAGFRWENQSIVGTNGKVVQKISVPILPRVGFTYILDRAGSQKIFGSYGRFSQKLSTHISTNYHSDGGYDFVILYNQDPRISGSTGITVLDQKHLITEEIKDLHGQYFEEFSLGFEQSLGWNLILSLQGSYRTLREVIDNIWLASENRYQYGNPGRGFMSDVPKPKREYSALTIAIERQLDKQFNFLASYVLSRNYGNYGGLFDAYSHNGFPNENISFNIRNEDRSLTTGLLPNDRTHLFKFAGSYRFSFGIVTGISFTAQSGTPLSEFGDENIGLRLLNQRGANGRTPMLWDLNARFIYEIPSLSMWNSKLILDLFHTASQRKPVDIDQIHYNAIDENGNPINQNPTYGLAYRYQPPMSVRLGMEVSF